MMTGCLDELINRTDASGWSGHIPRRCGAVYPQVPSKVEYSLTEIGYALAPAIAALMEWAELRQVGLALGEKLAEDHS